MAFSDGTNVCLFPAAQDHKRVYDDDQGPNTGGMGAYAPAPLGTPSLMEEIKSRVIQPAIDGMRAEGFPFVGVIYAGMMVTAKGIYTIEFNCRLGDPETEVLLPLLKSDLYHICMDCIKGKLQPEKVEFMPRGHFAVTVVAASPGYPGKYPTGLEITGCDDAEACDPNITVYHAGTTLDEGKLVTSGGRVLTVTAVGTSVRDASNLAYKGISKINFDGIHYRRDIAFRVLNRHIRIGVLGSTRGTALQPLLDGIKDGSVKNCSVELIVSNKSDAGILVRAKDNGISFNSVDAKGKTRESVDQEISALFKAANVDLILLIGYMRILSAPFVNQWKDKILNVHPSLLPAFAGGMDLQVKHL